jgi:Kinesin motor domain
LWEMAASTRLTGSAGEPPPASLSKLTREDGPGGLIPRCAAWLLGQAAAAAASSSNSSSAQQRSSKGGRSAPPQAAATTAQLMHISVSYLEIYNEKVYDLLALRPAAAAAGAAASAAAGAAHAAATPSLEIKIDGLGGVYVPGCTELRVSSCCSTLTSSNSSFLKWYYWRADFCSCVEALSLYTQFERTLQLTNNAAVVHASSVTWCSSN